MLFSVLSLEIEIGNVLLSPNESYHKKSYVSVSTIDIIHIKRKVMLVEVRYKLYYTVVTCIVTDNFSPCHLTLIQSTICIYWKCRNSTNAYILYFKNNRTAFHKIQGKFWQLLDSFLPWYLKSALVIFANWTNYAVMPSLKNIYGKYIECAGF